jgi:uncharacterized protein (DUF2132 family)
MVQEKANQAKQKSQANNPLHGISLKMIVERLVEHYGWPKLGQQIPLKCFTINPTINSSLKLLRRTPWARKKVEKLYLRTWFNRKID